MAKVTGIGSCEVHLHIPTSSKHLPGGAADRRQLVQGRGTSASALVESICYNGAALKTGNGHTGQATGKGITGRGLAAGVPARSGPTTGFQGVTRTDSWLGVSRKSSSRFPSRTGGGWEGDRNFRLECWATSVERRPGPLTDRAPESIFDVTNPWSEGLPRRTNQRDVNQAWEVLRNDVLYLDYRARQDVLAIKSAHDKVVESLNPVVREQKSATALRRQLQDLQEDLAQAHEKVHISEARVEHTLRRLAELESVVDSKLLVPTRVAEAVVSTDLPVPATPTQERKKILHRPGETKTRQLDISGPVRPYLSCLKNYWYPVAFSSDIDASTLVPFDCFEEPWVLFRGEDGRPGCVRDECAHRACPLSLGTVVGGRVQCPYHGWEFSTTGSCEHQPSTKPTKVSIQSLPCVEHEGMVWIWPGNGVPHSSMPSLSPPKGYTIHAEIVLELPVEHGLLVENLLDLAHAPFTHTTTFAKGWVVPNLVRFKTAAAAALRGNWDPYPIDMEFRPPCMVLSTIGLAKPGQLDGQSAKECAKHLFQLHCCLPSSRGKTRLLYRMALDFAGWAKFVPFVDRLWKHLANQVLAEDLRLVLGQQDRMHRGANVWNHPVAYDKLGVRYRRWRNSVEAGEPQPPPS